jgi:serine/threonine-protein kinase
MSPEQLLDREVDHRTDIYSLAVMLIESLTGRLPFQGDALTDILRAQQSTFRLPGSSPSARALEELLQHCLTINPTDRIASAATLRAHHIPLLRDCERGAFTF